jgi:DNA-nicking Smr family endonuclease
MDFGDILDQWETGKPAPVKKSAVAAEVAEKQEHPLDAWLRSNRVIDKDAQYEPEQDAAERRRRIRLKKPDDHIDIHGLTRDEAWQAMEQFFHHSHMSGFEKVLIIHGKGNHSMDGSILKRCVREFIEKCPYAGQSGQSDTGGSGATWVLLKNND